MARALEASVAEAEAVYRGLPPEGRAGAAALALHLGRPALAAAWATDPLTRAAARLRLGEWEGARRDLANLPVSARREVLLARAGWLAAEATAPAQAEAARQLARQEGDAAALVAAVTLLGEMELGEIGLAPPYAALRTLAEGLKVAEVLGQSADAHLLAVLAHAQSRLGGERGQRTAAKALERSQPRSPARVVALLALGEPEQADAEARAGELHPAWWRAFSGGKG